MVYLTGGLRYTVYLTGRAQYMVNLAARAQYARLTCQPARVLSTILPLSCNHRQALGQEPHPQITHRSAQPRTTQWSHGTPRFDWHCICKERRERFAACMYEYSKVYLAVHQQLSLRAAVTTPTPIHIVSCTLSRPCTCTLSARPCTLYHQHTNAHQRNGTIYMWVAKMLRTVR